MKNMRFHLATHLTTFCMILQRLTPCLAQIPVAEGLHDSSPTRHRERSDAIQDIEQVFHLKAPLESRTSAKFDDEHHREFHRYVAEKSRIFGANSRIKIWGKLNLQDAGIDIPHTAASISSSTTPEVHESEHGSSVLGMVGQGVRFGLAAKGFHDAARELQGHFQPDTKMLDQYDVSEEDEKEAYDDAAPAEADEADPETLDEAYIKTDDDGNQHLPPEDEAQHPADSPYAQASGEDSRSMRGAEPLTPEEEAAIVDIRQEQAAADREMQRVEARARERARARSRDRTPSPSGNRAFIAMDAANEVNARADAFALDFRDIDAAAVAAVHDARQDALAALCPGSEAVQDAARESKKSFWQQVNENAAQLSDGTPIPRESMEAFHRSSPQEQARVMHEMGQAALLGAAVVAPIVLPAVAPLVGAALAPELAIMTAALAPEIAAGSAALGATGGLVAGAVRATAQNARNPVVATVVGSAPVAPRMSTLERISKMNRLAERFLNRPNLQPGSWPAAANNALPGAAPNRNIPSAVAARLPGSVANRNLPMGANDQQLAQDIFMRQRLVPGEGPAIPYGAPMRPQAGPTGPTLSSAATNNPPARAPPAPSPQHSVPEAPPVPAPRAETNTLPRWFESRYWNRHENFTHRGQTNKVYKRDDIIDPHRVDIKTGLTNKQLMQQGNAPYGPDGQLTNKQLMQQGNAPYGPDGQLINLHHMLQTHNGPIAEVTKTFHNANGSVIHINPSSIPSGINRPRFDAWREFYWKARANDF